VRQKIQRGLEAAEQGRTITHEEAIRRMSRWLET
jgi:predicted transcriptional regulator